MTASAAPTLIGSSAMMRQLKDEIDRVARSDARVLITGESGVGKELVAHAVHARSTRSTRVFAAVNCAGMPETLLESELFGHTKGSFTGAYRDKAGKFEQAEQGTIFLDEVGEMSLRMQGLLLRFLGTGEIQKVGADGAPTRVNVRVLAATNRNLHEMVLQGRFREDLYYRLNVIHLTVPALRERREDIPLLAEHFLRRFTAEPGSTVRSIAPEALALLVGYTWPGNVRELENTMERVVVTGREPVVRPEHLPAIMRGSADADVAPGLERGRTVADELIRKIRIEGQSFWRCVYPLYIQREITRSDLRDVVRRGMEESRGSYKILTRLFNMEPTDYKRFLNFLRKHDCHVSFKEYRT